MSKSPVATATLMATKLAPAPGVGRDCQVSTCCCGATGGAGVSKGAGQHQIRLISKLDQSRGLVVKPKRIRQTPISKETTIKITTGKVCLSGKDFDHDHDHDQDRDDTIIKNKKNKREGEEISSQPHQQAVIPSDTNDNIDTTIPIDEPVEPPSAASQDGGQQTSLQTNTSSPRLVQLVGSGQDTNNNDHQPTKGANKRCNRNNHNNNNNNSITIGAQLGPAAADQHQNQQRPAAQMQQEASNGNGNGNGNSHMPWFGIDVGGSLVKVVFFDPSEPTADELVTLRRIRRYLKSARFYGKTGKLDTHLEMSNCLINQRAGSLHFIRFATNEMQQFLRLAKAKQFTQNRRHIGPICATGGGACKFERDIEENLGIKLEKTDEMDSIIYGIHYIDKYNSERECYWLESPLDETRCLKVPYDFSRPYPYLVVNIGSGVSILAVHSATEYSRVSGSPIGGGTFLGLCCLLTQCDTFDEAIRLANHGQSTRVDKLVRDIYGGDYKKFNLSGETVASAFGHMNLLERRQLASREDLARALLEMVTINIGSLAMMCAQNAGIERVVFIGNFLRVNQLSMRLLSNAVNYWSRGAIKALFLEHEGYFGAVGCFVESTQGQQGR